MFETDTFAKTPAHQPKYISEHFISGAWSVFAYLFFFLSATLLLPAFFVLWLISLLFDRNRRMLHGLCSWLAYRTLFISPLVQCRMEGLTNLCTSQPCIMVANHQSVIDIVVLCGLPASFKWVAKDSIFQIPVIGWIMKMNGYVCLVSKTLQGRVRMFKKSQEWLKRGLSILMFPEGTRSRTGELLAFKNGPFRLAVACGVPIVPIVIDGTGAMLPKYARRLQLPADMRVSVLPAVHPDLYGNDAVALRNSVRTAMAKGLKEMRSLRSSAPEATCLKK